MRELPSGTVTFLFTDIEGSTQLLRELGEETYADTLAEHRTVLRDAFSRHGGEEVDTQGDAFFVAFPTAPGALAAAREAQAALSIPVRMGLHTGTPLLTHEGYVGADVHRAARIAAAGHGRQVLLSAATAALVETDQLCDLSEHRLKDLSAPERIWQLGDGEFPPLKTLNQTNLPVPATAFVGREQEVAEASQLLVDGVRLLTLSGPGGTGKTRLALQTAAAAADGYPDGIWWVPLAPLSDPALVLPTAGEVLGTKRDLAVEIGEKRLLLLLDNFEHVIDAARGVGALVAACPHLTVLVTSRERLQVAGEHEYAVSVMASSDGLELFAARVRALGTELGGDESARELCERLDNLPLALELAAARTKLFTPAQLLDRLGQRLDLFKGGRDADARQRTLRATIEWSYDLLTPEEQQLFARLSVFSGGSTFEAARAICDADEDTLQSLLDKSLLRGREDPGGELRYWMLETIRQFAAERLAERSDGNAIDRRHAEWHAELAETLQERVRAGDSAGTSRLTADISNIRAALEWLAAHGDVRNGLRIVWGLWFFWLTRGLAAEALRWADWAVAEAPKVPPAERRFGLLGASELHRTYGDPELAVRLKRDALQLIHEFGPEPLVAAVLADMADLCANLGDFEEARSLAREALELQRKLGAPGEGIAHALSSGAIIEFRAGDFGRALALYEEAISYEEEQRAPTNLAGNLLMAGECARRAGDLAKAAGPLRRALELFGGLEHRGDYPELFQEIGAASTRPREAVRLLAVSERLRAEMDIPRWDPADYGQSVARLRAELGEEAFNAAWAEGSALSEGEALALADRCLD